MRLSGGKGPARQGFFHRRFCDMQRKIFPDI
jgi:hypothetical protein